MVSDETGQEKVALTEITATAAGRVHSTGNHARQLVPVFARPLERDI